MSQTLNAALIELQTLEMSGLVLVFPTFHNSKTMPSAPIGGLLPYMVHIPESGSNSFMTVDGDPQETSQSAPIHERTYRLKFRLLLAPISEVQSGLSTLYDDIVTAIDAIPTFYAAHRMLSGTVRRLMVAEKEQNQNWIVATWTLLGEEYVGIEWNATIQLDADVITGQ